MLVANLVRGADGGWGTLDSRCLFRHARTVGFVCQAQLRWELSCRLGVRWRPVVRGSAELEGVPATVLRAFSQRRADIKRVLAERGQSSAAAAQVATLATRSAKDHGQDHRVLRAEWIARAAGLSFTETDIPALFHHEPEPALEPPPAAEVAMELTGEHATFQHRDVVRVFARRARPGAPVEVVEDWAEKFLAGAHAIRVADDVYSTPEMLLLERAVVAHAVRRRGDHAAVAPREVIEAALAGRWTLSDEQVAMVRRLTTSGAGVDIALGVAGAGKTAALDAARDAWQASGHRVIGAALAARAAARLQEGSGLTSHTLAALLRDLDQPEGALAPGTVIVLDEAGMVGTRRLAQLLAHTAAANAKVVLVGDHRQLPEIGPGGAFRGLADRFAASELTHNQRQHDPVERHALANLRAGQAALAVRELSRRGRITTAPYPGQLRDQMVRDWLKARDQGRDAIMLAARRCDVADLNHRARHALLERGDIPADGIEVAGRPFAIGDRVMALANRRRLDILNGDRATITATDPDQHRLTVQVDRGHAVTLPAAYLRAGHLTHAYATTIHKAQGLTCDHTLLLADDHIFQEAGYTALSRGRDHNHLYVIRPEPAEHETQHYPRPAPGDPINELVDALESSRAKTMALDHTRQRLRTLPTPAPAPPEVGVGLDG